MRIMHLKSPGNPRPVLSFISYIGHVQALIPRSHSQYVSKLAVREIQHDSFFHNLRNLLLEGLMRSVVLDVIIPVVGARKFNYKRMCCAVLEGVSKQHRTTGGQ